MWQTFAGISKLTGLDLLLETLRCLLETLRCLLETLRCPSILDITRVHGNQDEPPSQCL